MGAALALMTAGCVASGSFPAVLDDPAPRANTTLNPDQVKAATAELVSERERLCAEALAEQGVHSSSRNAADCGPDATTTGSTRPAGTGAKP